MNPSSEDHASRRSEPPWTSPPVASERRPPLDPETESSSLTPRRAPESRIRSRQRRCSEEHPRCDSETLLTPSPKASGESSPRRTCVTPKTSKNRRTLPPSPAPPRLERLGEASETTERPSSNAAANRVAFRQAAEPPRPVISKTSRRPAAAPKSCRPSFAPLLGPPARECLELAPLADRCRLESRRISAAANLRGQAR